MQRRILPCSKLTPLIKKVFYAFILISYCKISFAQQYKLSKIDPIYPIPALNNIATIQDIIQDRAGFIWIATQNGLYKFDGYTVTHYLFDPNQPDKLGGNWIQALTEDDAGNIWIGVFGIGLQKLDPLTEKFTLFKADPSNPNALFNDRIMQLSFNNRKLWICGQEGVCSFSPGTGKFKTYTKNAIPRITTTGNELWDVDDLNEGFVISLYDPKLDSFIAWDTLKSKAEIIQPYTFGQNKLYMTLDGILHAYDLKSKKLLPIKTDGHDLINAISYFDGHLIFFDSPDKLEIFDIKKENFETHEVGFPIGQSTKKFLRLRNGDLWGIAGVIFKISIDDKGIETYNLMINGQRRNYFSPSAFSEWDNGLLGIGKSILLDFNNSTALKSSSKYPSLATLDSAYEFENRNSLVYVDENKDSWIALFEKIINVWQITFFKFSFSTKKLEKLGTIPTNGTIMGLTKIGDDLWLADWNGLVKWNIPSSKSTFIGEGKDSTKLCSVGLRYCFKDRDGDLWIGTQNGLNLKKKNKNYFIHFLSRTGDTTSLSFNGIANITQDEAGVIWIGTQGGGVNLFDKKTGKFSWITSRQGLSSDDIGNIIIDEQQNAWVSHKKGISRIDGKTKKIENFTNSDGVQDYYGESESIRLSDGSIIFTGGMFTRIVPSKIKAETFVPPLLITNFKLFNKSLLLNSTDSVLQKDIYTSRSITLNYKQNVITLEYASLDMAYADQRNYAYQLEGFDADWQYVNNRREVTYTNLSQGLYTFKLKTADRYGQWHEMETPLIIRILPPWWKMWWAYVLFILVFLIALRFFIRWRIKTLKAEKIFLEEKVADRTHELKEEKEKVESTLSELKSTQTQLIQSEKMASLGELTAGIAHEIQNPLNFVNNFSEVNTELIDELEQEADKGNISEVKSIVKDIKENEQKINHHGKRADAIVKGMLQHSRSSTGVKGPTDINALADEYFRLAYHGLRAKEKNFNATMKTDFDSTIGKINIIPQDIGRVLLNLYNNAFYAVNEKIKQNIEGYEPTVLVSTKKTNDKVVLTVMDNGNGIPQKVIDKIFQPFFTTKPTGQGTGLGLSLSYDIIKAHGGEIKVETKEGEFTEFNIILPV